jgi:hypothetical protein
LPRACWIFSGILAAFLAGVVPPVMGGTLTSAMVDGNVVVDTHYAYPGQGASGGYSDCCSASFSAANSIYGWYIHHGVETEDMYLGSYDVQLNASASAFNGGAEIGVQNHTNGGSWLDPGAMTIESTARAEAYFEDTLIVASPEAQWVELGYDVDVTTEFPSPWTPPAVWINGEPWSSSGHYVYYQLLSGYQLPSGPTREVPLSVSLFREMTCSGYYEGYDCDNSAFYSVRLTDARVFADHGPADALNWVGPWDGVYAEQPYLVADQRIFSRDGYYPGISNIELIPEPSTFWMFAGMLAVVATRLRTVRIACSRPGHGKISR